MYVLTKPSDLTSIVTLSPRTLLASVVLEISQLPHNDMDLDAGSAF